MLLSGRCIIEFGVVCFIGPLRFSGACDIVVLINVKLQNIKGDYSSGLMGILNVNHRLNMVKCARRNNITKKLSSDLKNGEYRHKKVKVIIKRL